MAETPKLPEYRFAPRTQPLARAELLKQLGLRPDVPDAEHGVLDEVVAHAAKLDEALNLAIAAERQARQDGQDPPSPAARLAEYASFLPPRVVAACRDAQLIPFFGSGVSMPAGIPTWAGLLAELGLETDYVTDPHAEHDPLTQAELISHTIGADALQHKIVEITKAVTRPTLAHRLLAELNLPVYITTNYDDLFERAWKARWETEPIVVTNDAETISRELTGDVEFPRRNDAGVAVPVLIKMHGDAGGAIPQLILTRSDYRRHYRANAKLFELIKDLMRSSVVLLLGFSHRDPEVARLVEDMVFRFETGLYPDAPRPLFSVQFDMRQRTPEVFAARGIVALRPPALFTTLGADAARSLSISTELIELLFATTDVAHDAVDLEQKLGTAVDEIETEVSGTMGVLKRAKQSVVDNLSSEIALQPILDGLLRELGTRAGQGVYAARQDGSIAGYAVPAALPRAERAIGSVSPRPYFAQASMFRHEFVSDVFESKFNQKGTVFFCVPLGTPSRFEGLLFAAAQPGAWKKMMGLRDAMPADLNFILVDSNGIAVVPPLRELRPTPPGDDDANLGFLYAPLHELSRRDAHITHIVQNIVPIGYDDDVHDVSTDLRLYSMVAAVEGTRWKLALSKRVPGSVPRPNTEPKKR